MRVVRWILLAAAFAAPPLPVPAAEAPAKRQAQAAPRKKAPPKPTTSQLLAMIEEQRALIDAQERLIAEQKARIAEQDTKIEDQGAEIQAQKAGLAELEARLAALSDELAVMKGELPAAKEQQELADRLKRVEEAAQKEPELPPTVVSAGDFPGSIRIPGTDAAVKFGGRVRTAGVFTLGPLGSEDRFLTNSIPVEADDEAAGKGARTTFSANTSRLNFEVRTPTGAGHMRAFLEGDFFGSTTTEKRTDFRLRHAFAQFGGALVGQTWSTFSDPAANHQDLDFEGINGENVIRQPQFRYTWQVREGLSVAVAAETPEVSLTDASLPDGEEVNQGVNVVPDLIGRAVWKIQQSGHIQTAVVFREIRGEWSLDPSTVQSVLAWGASVSGVVPFRYFDQTDRLIFQLNFGKGNARYINDLNSLGGQDAVFNSTGHLEALPAEGGYIDFEHQWKHWETTRVMKLRSSFIWSYVAVRNLDFQAGDAYRRTNRLSVNLVFSPIERIDVGAEYIYGTRENKDGNRGSSDQLQLVGIFRF